jgi:hypothetical protein
MSDETLIASILENLDTAIANMKDKRGSRDCLDDCATAYDSCMAIAGSNLEKAACKSIYTKCVSNC